MNTLLRMARLPYLEAEDAPPHVAERLRRAPDLNIFKLVAHAHDTLGPWLRFGASILRDLELDPELREIAILRVARLTPGARYEWVQHESIARDIGIAPERIEGARTGQGATPDDALVIRFTEQVVSDASPDDETLSTARQRFTSREIVELLLVIGQYMMLGRVMATAQIDLDLPIRIDALIPETRPEHG
jgi:4-carboxymuconolactone decarboxylase